MHNYIVKKIINQDCNASFVAPSDKSMQRRAKKRLRRLQQQQAFNLFTQQPSLQTLLDLLGRSSRRKHAVLFRLFNILINFARYRPNLYFSEAWLAKKCKAHFVSISRLLNRLADLGVLWIEERPPTGAGNRQTNLYHLNPMLNTQHIQLRLREYVSVFRYFAIHLLFSFAVGQATNEPLISLIATNVKQIEIGNYFISGKRSVGRGVPETEASFISLSVTESSAEVRTRGVDQMHKVPQLGISSRFQDSMQTVLRQIKQNLPQQEYAAPSSLAPIAVEQPKQFSSPKGNVMSSEAPPEKYTYFKRLEQYEKLRMTPFGMMKLSIIPEGISHSLYEAMRAGQNYTYDQFFQKCQEQCEAMKIDLKPRWARFFSTCQQRGIDPKKTPVVKPYVAPPVIHQKRENVLSEADFWICEIAKYKNRIKWRALGPYIKNPYEDYMKTLDAYQYPQLYAIYKDVHVNGTQNPDLLPQYHQELIATFPECIPDEASFINH